MQRIVDLIYKLYNLFFQNIFINFKKEKWILKENTKLQDVYKGKRCFILGNGPSLNQEDLTILDGEIVFTVNQIARNKQFEKISPRCHFWIDKNFFNIDDSCEADLELLETMKAIAQRTDVTCFYPVDQEVFVKKHGLDNSNVRYLAPRLFLLNENNLKVDISKYTYSVGTVVQQAILTAIYMGFSEIYLLGCDATSILCTINSALKTENNLYSYEVTQNEKERMEKMVKNSRITDYAYSYYMMLKGFTILNEMCLDKGITLVNCSKETVLDMIPQINLEYVINNKVK